MNNFMNFYVVTQKFKENKFLKIYALIFLPSIMDITNTRPEVLKFPS